MLTQDQVNVFQWLLYIKMWWAYVGTLSDLGTSIRHNTTKRLPTPGVRYWVKRVAITLHLCRIYKTHFVIFNLLSDGTTRDSVVEIATRNGLSNPGGRYFPHPSGPVLWPTLPPILGVPGLFPGVKAAGAWR